MDAIVFAKDKIIGSQEVTPEIKAAFKEVSRYFVDVTMVIFGTDTRWLWLNEDRKAPDFSNSDIDVSILEEAADSLDSFPAVFEIIEIDA